jgi:hypothetical protein
VLTEDEANALPRTPAKEVLDFVVKECDAIADKLPVDYSKLGDDAAANETGRVGKLAVLALKARTLLYEASPLFNTNDDKELYHQASSVLNRMAFAFPVFRIERFAGVISTFSDSSFREIFLRAIITSKLTIIGILLIIYKPF